jgi:hypothetical protein
MERVLAPMHTFVLARPQRAWAVLEPSRVASARSRVIGVASVHTAAGTLHLMVWDTAEHGVRLIKITAIDLRNHSLFVSV